MFTCGYILHQFNPLFGTNVGIFLCRSKFLLARTGAFRNDYVAACSTALPSATEKKESGGYVTVPCPSNVT